MKLKNLKIISLEQDGYILEIILNISESSNFSKLKSYINNFVSLRDEYYIIVSIKNLDLNDKNSVSNFVKLCLNLKFYENLDIFVPRCVGPVTLGIILEKYDICEFKNCILYKD